MFNKCSIMIVLLMLTVWGHSFGVEQPLSIQKAFQLSVAVQDSQTLRVHWDIASNYYLYRDRINFRVRKYNSLNKKIGYDISLGYINWPESQLFTVPHIGKYQVYADSLTMAVPLQVFGLQHVVLDVYYQGCSHAGFCYPPTTKAIILNMQTTNNHFIPMTLSYIKTGSKRFSKYTTWRFEKRSWYLLMSFFGFGILLSFTPCQWPMFPILSAIIIGRKKRKLVRDTILALSFVLGMSITYAVIGMFFALLGESLQPIMQKPLVIIISSLLIGCMAISLFGLYQLTLPHSWQQKLSHMNQSLPGGQLLSVILMGILSSLVLSPCITPPLLSALTFIAHKGDVLMGIMFLTVLAWGMGLPLILFVIFGSRLMPKSGPWMIVVQRLLGCVLFGVAVWNFGRLLSWQVMIAFWGIYLIALALYWAFRTHHSAVNLLMKFLSVLIICYAILFVINSYRLKIITWNPVAWFERVNNMASTSLDFIKVTSLQDLENRISQAKHGNKNILLDYYANWCVACKKMEKDTFANPEIKKSLRRWTLIQVDITHMRTADTAMMQRYRVIAPPVVIIFYKENNQYKEKHIIGEQTLHSLLDVIQKTNGVNK